VGVVPAALTFITVPCFNEAARLRADGFAPLLARPDVRLVFVNDGSSDGTAEVLAALRASAPDRIDVVSLAENRGKAEAVRQGLLWSLAQGAASVGYLDADLSTPATEMARLVDALAGGADAVIGSRVALLGSDIRRDRHRHYLGRIFATVASLALAVPVYDTQCGAKVFRAGEPLREALAAPFRSRWTFDVELLGRLLAAGAREILEIPLHSWHDVPGSKLRLGGMVEAGVDLLKVSADLRRRRRR
jgi:dolichyl-phosphate beta-glucosyltransferase